MSSHKSVLQYSLFATVALTIASLVGCSFSESEPSGKKAPDRAVLGVCDVLGTMQECAGVLTEIYLNADERYESLDSPSSSQTEAIGRMQKASEFYSSECRSLTSRAGAEINMVNGCEDALEDIVAALNAMEDGDV